MTAQAVIDHARKLAAETGEVTDARVIDILAGIAAGLLPNISSGFVRAKPMKVPAMRLDDQRPIDLNDDGTTGPAHEKPADWYSNAERPGSDRE